MAFIWRFLAIFLSYVSPRSWKTFNSREECPNKRHMFLDSMVYQELKFMPEKFKKIRVFFESRPNLRPWVKSENLVKQIFFKCQFFTLKTSAFMTYGQFPLRNDLKLRFVFFKIWESYDAAGMARLSRGMTF